MKSSSSHLHCLIQMLMIISVNYWTLQPPQSLFNSQWELSGLPIRAGVILFDQLKKGSNQIAAHCADCRSLRTWEIKCTWEFPMIRAEISSICHSVNAINPIDADINVFIAKMLPCKNPIGNKYNSYICLYNRNRISINTIYAFIVVIGLS